MSDKQEVMWRGIVKVMEECGELVQAAGKLQAFPDAPHPDGKGHAIERVKEEMADVVAIIQFFCTKHDIELDQERMKQKIILFTQWGDELAGATKSI